MEEPGLKPVLFCFVFLNNLFPKTETHTENPEFSPSASVRVLKELVPMIVEAGRSKMSRASQ